MRPLAKLRKFKLKRGRRLKTNETPKSTRKLNNMEYIRFFWLPKIKA